MIDSPYLSSPLTKLQNYKALSCHSCAFVFTLSLQYFDCTLHASALFLHSTSCAVVSTWLSVLCPQLHPKKFLFLRLQAVYSLMATDYFLSFILCCSPLLPGVRDKSSLQVTFQDGMPHADFSPYFYFLPDRFVGLSALCVFIWFHNKSSMQGVK